MRPPSERTTPTLNIEIITVFSGIGVTVAFTARNGVKSPMFLALAAVK
jgi:hypothetical protein